MVVVVMVIIIIIIIIIYIIRYTPTVLSSSGYWAMKI